MERQGSGSSIRDMRLVTSCHHYSWKGCVSVTGVTSAEGFAYSETIHSNVCWVQQPLIDIKCT